MFMEDVPTQKRLYGTAGMTGLHLTMVTVAYLHTIVISLPSMVLLKMKQLEKFISVTLHTQTIIA